jgi:hypothetical protein
MLVSWVERKAEPHRDTVPVPRKLCGSAHTAQNFCPFLTCTVCILGDSFWSDNAGHEPGLVAVQSWGSSPLLTQSLQHAWLILFPCWWHLLRRPCRGTIIPYAIFYCFFVFCCWRNCIYSSVRTGISIHLKPMRSNSFKAGLWIRIDSIRIRIQQYSSILIRIRIRIHKVIESGSTTVL